MYLSEAASAPSLEFETSWPAYIQGLLFCKWKSSSFRVTLGSQLFNGSIGKCGDRVCLPMEAQGIRSHDLLALFNCLLGVLEGSTSVK